MYSSDLASSRIRRAAALYLQPEEILDLDLSGLFAGGSALTACNHWLALAPHLGQPVPVDEDEIRALGRIGETLWMDWATACQGTEFPILKSLLDKGLLLVKGQVAADASIRDGWWHPLAALTHSFSRWSGIEAAQRDAQFSGVEEMVAVQGPPPPHYHQRSDALQRCLLPAPDVSELDALMARRTTCRNFDTRPLPLGTLSTVLKRVFGIQGEETLAPGVVAIKKMSPSGGALHPLEAYLLVRRVSGLQAGLYHYHVGTHALDRLPSPDLQALQTLALTAVAGQQWFADAAVQIVLTARFTRSHWKYRRHPKIYRAIVLEAGHLSQNLYLAATEHGLGAFVTAAINEVDLEQAFGLDPMVEGPLAICGLGWRGKECETVEFDPQGQVWGHAPNCRDT